MREIRRHAYLEAMGIDTYVRRRRPPGTVPRPVPVDTPVPGEPEGTRCERAGSPPDSAGVSLSPVASGTAEAAQPTPAVAAEPAPVPCRLNLAVILAGRWLWLEDLQGRPLASEQVYLVRSMAHALGFAGSSGPPEAEVSHFDWPVHNNRQLDNSEEAAKASLTAFLQRRMERCGCSGIVLLGDACRSRVDTEALDAPLAVTVSTAQMLAHPELKRRAWTDLQPLRGELRNQ